ncbi:uncharacterized protein [Procambarus clarkii]|uniref:uncharacterized protein n=1 Tax=Procambarus clarkii TaxID=6728 RepID=UPI001E6745FA|nr:uncharacterized protein LOC123773334 [Procambarus clarkii]XP_045622938.1 uncharacterized protein LOC123773334 [Procambarus clarkii]
MSSRENPDYVTVATFVVKEEGLEAVSEDVASTEEITSVVDEDHSESGNVAVSYIDAVETTVIGSDDPYASTDQDNQIMDIEDTDGGGRSFTLWSLPAVRTLLDIYEEHEQAYVDKTMRRRAFWELVSEKMRKQAYYYDWSSCRIRFKGMCRKVLYLARHGKSKRTQRLWWEKRVERIMEHLEPEFLKISARGKTGSSLETSVTCVSPTCSTAASSQVCGESVKSGVGDATITKDKMLTQGKPSKKKRQIEPSEASKETEAPDWFKKYFERKEVLWAKQMAIEEQRHTQVVQLLSQNNELLQKLCNILDKMDSQHNLVKIAPKPSGWVSVPVRAQKVVCTMPQQCSFPM